MSEGEAIAGARGRRCHSRAQKSRRNPAPTELDLDTHATENETVLLAAEARDSNDRSIRQSDEDLVGRRYRGGVTISAVERFGFTSLRRVGNAHDEGGRQVRLTYRC